MKKLGLMYGGRSTEHDGSLKTKRGVMEMLNQDIYQIVDIIYTDREGNIFLNELASTLGAVIDHIKRNTDVFYLNLMPGNEGEDGSWSGVFDICDGRGSFESVNTSSILMNKYQQNCVAVTMLPDMVLCPASAFITRGAQPDTINKIIDSFSSEVIIKPNNLGSSHFIDIFTPSEKTKINEFLVKLFEFDQTALIQEFIEGDNYSCGVITSKDGLKALPVVFQQIEERYMSQAIKFVGAWPKVITYNSIAERIQKQSVILAKLFNVTGMCRFDFITKGDNIYYLEGNIVPSLASGGSFYYMLKAADIDFNDFLADMIYAFENRIKNNKLLIASAK